MYKGVLGIKEHFAQLGVVRLGQKQDEDFVVISSPLLLVGVFIYFTTMVAEKY